MKIILKLYLTAIVLILLSGCSQKESVFLNANINKDSCWENLKFGQNKTDVQGLLKFLSNIDQNSYKWAPSNNNSFDESLSWRFIDKREKSGSVSFKNYSLVACGLSYKNNITLGEIISKIGEPGKIFVYSTISGNMTYSEIFIIFPQKGICLTQNADISVDAQQYKITSNEKIKYIFFTNPEKDPFQNINGCLYGIENTLLSKTENWNGYGSYSVNN